MSARNLKGDVMDYKSLLSIIPVGKEKCITQKQLAAKLQCSTSAAKLLVKIAREHHIAILSGTDGYWISTSKKDTEKFCSELRRKASSYSRIANSIDPAIQDKQIAGQLSINDIYPNDNGGKGGQNEEESIS